VRKSKEPVIQIVENRRHPLLVVADPSLCDNAGHHYLTSLRLVRSSEQFGFSGLLAAHKGFKQAIPRCAILNLYSETIYHGTLSIAASFSRSNSHKEQNVTSIGAETLSLRDSLYMSSEDLIFFHTMTINATISVLEGLLISGTARPPSHHFLFRYDPLLESWAGDAADLQRLLAQLKERSLTDQIFLYAETHTLAGLYENLIDFPVDVMLHFSSIDLSAYTGARKASPRLQVAYLGEARVEKGFDALPDGIARAYDAWHRGFHFVCQTYATKNNEAGIVEAVARLRVDAATREYQLFDILDAESYSSLLLTSDVIILPHRLPQYARRGSGIFVDALCSGATIVLRSGSWMSSFADKMGTVEFDNDAELAEAICVALTRARDVGRKTLVKPNLFVPESNIELVLNNHRKRRANLDFKAVNNEALGQNVIDDLYTVHAPYFSIITAARNDAWSLIKTMRSVFEQSFIDYEYIVIDGASEDNSSSLIEFWRQHGLVAASISEPDTGVYNAMNKGLRMASGQFVCFLNASDIFSDSNVLKIAHDLLSKRPIDGLLGWGELTDQIWGSWTEGEAFKMASLGFCHQSLFVRRTLLLEEPFDERSFKTDSDTLQLGRLYAKGARIAIVPEVFAVRGGEPGISADLQRSGISIANTMAEEYPGLTESDAELVLDFRRKCHNPEAILSLLDLPDRRFVAHLARVVLDTLFQRQSIGLDSTMCERLIDRTVLILNSEDGGTEDLDRLAFAQTRRAQLLDIRKIARRNLDQAVTTFAAEEERRIAKFRANLPAHPLHVQSNLIVSLTSFPARLKTVSFAIQSLFEQTCTPREIHLWLGRDEVPGKNWLPRRLCELEERGLNIHFAKRTFHHYDKFLHNADLNRSAPFVIVDDDVIYPPKALEHLLQSHRSHPEAIVGNRCHKIEIDSSCEFAPYMTWKRETRMPEPSFLLIPTGAGGVLYPPGFLNRRTVTDIENILACAPYADDIWLKFCALANSAPTFATELSHKSDWYHRYTPTMHVGSLMATNVDRGLNDVQIARCAAWLTRASPEWRTILMADRTLG
jgi:hypothetical protein